LRRFYLALEHRVLHTLTDIEAGAGDTAQARSSGRTLCVHIVGNEHQHRSLLPHEGRVAVEVATQMPSQHLRLGVRHEAERYRLVEEGVTQLVALALLPGNQHALAGLVGEPHTACFLDREVACRQLAAIDEAERQPVSQHWAQFLHQVEGETRAAGTVGM
jgi:hypothetical protein